MFQDGPMTPAEEHADAAWQDYADAAQAARAAWDRPGASMAERRTLHERLIEAEKRFRAAFDRLNGPTPPDALDERNRLACEGTLLVSLLAAFVGLFLPDLIAEFWPLAITFALVGALGAWTYQFVIRLSRFLERSL